MKAMGCPETLSADRVEFSGLQGLPVLVWQSQTGIETVTPKGVLLPTVCDVSATHEGS